MIAAVAATLFLLTGNAQASQPGFRFGPPWKAVEVVHYPRPAWFTDIVATGRDSAWAVGAHTGSGANATVTTGGFALRWNGKRWLSATLPVSPFVPVSVSAHGKSGIWVLGYRPPANVSHPIVADALVLNGGHWRILRLPSGSTLFWNDSYDLQSTIISARDVWVIGNYLTSPASGEQFRSVLWNWNGSRWSSHPLPVAGADSVSAVAGAVWVTTISGRGVTTAYQWTGKSWRRWKLPFVTDGTVAVDSANNVWIGGADTAFNSTTYMLHFNGRRWTRGQTPLSSLDGPTFGDGRGGVWFSQFAHETRGRWYEPSRWPTWKGCNGDRPETGELAPVPGSSAVWFAGVCQSGRADVDQPMLGINGRL